MHLIVKLLKALNSETNPWQIAFAIAIGMVVGLTPLMKLHNLILLLIVLCFRINISMFLASWVVFSGIAYILDPMMMGIGHSVLTSTGLQGLWEALYSTSFGRITQFNNTLTMGSLVFSLVLFIPVLFASKYVVVKYRDTIMVWVNQLKIVEFLKGTRLFQLYMQVEGH